MSDDVIFHLVPAAVLSWYSEPTKRTGFPS